MKNSFVLYHDQYEAIRDLTLEQKGQLLDAIFLYHRDGVLPEHDPMIKMAFRFFKIVFDRDKEKWEAGAKRRRENGKKGGRPKTKKNLTKPKEPNRFNNNLTKPTKPVSVSVSVSDSVSDSVSETPPPYPPPEENMFSQEITDFFENHRREIKELFEEKTGIDSYKVQTESLEALHELTTQHGVKLKDLDKMLKWGLQDEFWKKHLVNLGNLSKVKNNGRFGYYNLQEKYEGREKTIEEQTSRESYYQYFCEKKAEFEALTAERQEYMRKYHGTDGKMSWECDDMKDWFENYGKDKDE